MGSVQKKRLNLLSIGERTSFSDSFLLRALIHPLLDGGSSGLPSLYAMDEILSRLAHDLQINEEPMPWRHFELMIGTGPGGRVHCLS
jgi:hypothetical protein